MTIVSCTGCISSRSQTQFRRFFSWLGIHIYRKPWLFIVIGLILTLSCSVGFLFFQQETKGIRLWIPQDTEVWSDYITIIDTFGSYPSKMVLLLTNDDKSDSMLSPTNMDIAYEIFNAIDNIELKYEGNTYDYNSLCLRPYPIAPFCTSHHANIFGFFFNSNSELWQNNTFIEDVINVNNSAIQGFAGGLQRDESGYVLGANALLFIYELSGSTKETEQDIAHEYLLSFRDYWDAHENDYPGIQIEAITDRSFDDEISRVVDGDTPIFVGALITMLVYLVFTLGQFSCVGARPWLACSALLVMLCSMIIGFGISFLVGTEFNTICALAPYILLGVGVDDMIILVDTYQRNQISDTILTEEMRLSRALASSGLSISLTSFCSSMAFFVGSTTDLPAIQSFCMVAGWSFLANYFLQFLIFVPLMVYDEKRVLKQNNFCCPCCIHHDNDDIEENENNNDKKCTNNFKMEFFATRCIVPILSKKLLRWIIIILFFVVVGFSIYASFHLKTESDDSKIVPDDSYVLDYLENFRANFGENRVHDLNIIILNEDISRMENRDDIYALINALETEPDAIGKVQQWLTPFTDWMRVNKNETNVDDLTRTKYYNYLQQFANDTKYTAWDSEIIYNDFHTPTEIKATRFLLTAFRSASDSVNWDEYLRWNELCDEYIGSNAFIYELEHGFSFLAAHITIMTIFSMLFAAIGVCGVLLLLLDCRMALFILIIVLMIDIDLFGWMYLLDISLDIVSYLELVMAVGLTVDYVIHIAHAITEHMSGLTETNDEIYIEKLKLAMRDMGTSVLKGAFTTLLGVFALAFSKSEAFRIFFNMFLGIIIVAVAHGVLLVPALLGEFKFIYKGIKHENDDIVQPYDLETHSHLSKSNVQMMDYNSEQKDNLMEQLLNFKQKQQTQHTQFENDLNMIINNVNRLKNENILLTKENNNLKNDKRDEVMIENKNDDNDELEREIIHTLNENQKSQLEEDSNVNENNTNNGSGDENNTNNADKSDETNNHQKNKVNSDLNIDEMASMLNEIM